MEYTGNVFKNFKVHNSKYKSSYIALFVSLLITVTNVFAEDTPNLAKPKIVVPEMIAGVSTVSAEQVIETLTSDNPPILIDEIGRASCRERV